VSVRGVRKFAANAHLRSELALGGPPRQLWSAADGSGLADSPLVARFKAVSEALERWAHAALHGAEAGRGYGFDVDPSSNGLAAFPGLFARQARAAARAEAAERFNLLHWWEGQLRVVPVAAPWPECEAWVIESEAPGVTVLLHRSEPEGFHAFGHAAGRNVAGACAHALGELERHATAIRGWAARSAAGAVTSRPRTSAELGTQERRPLFFSTAAGYAAFRARVESAPRMPCARPRLVFDGVVRGPWSRYADVWRVVFAPPSRRFIADDPTYFYW
jgi:hypothetical protein